jgi:hypothetical protein
MMISMHIALSAAWKSGAGTSRHGNNAGGFRMYSGHG